MSTTSWQDHSNRPDQPPPAIRWQSWPLSESPAYSVAVTVGLLAAGAGILWITGKPHLAVLAVTALAIAVWRFFVPVWFELNTEGVNQWVFNRHRRIPWTAIGRLEIHATGVLLLPDRDACPLDAVRGLYLPWGQRKEEVLAQVHYYLDRTSTDTGE